MPFETPLYDPKKHQPVLFIDVDGVLAIHMDYLEPDWISRLTRVVNNLNAVVVVSSTWRNKPHYYRVLCDTLKAVGIEVVGKTGLWESKWEMEPDPEFEGDWQRVLEIRRWIHDNWPYPVPWVAVDDDVLALDDSHFVRTFMRTGLTESKAIEIEEKIQAQIEGFPQERQLT